MNHSTHGQALTELVVVIPLFICTGAALLPMAAQTSRHATDSFASLGVATSAATFSIEERTSGDWSNTFSLTITSVLENQLNPSNIRTGATQKEDSRFGDALKSEEAELANNCPAPNKRALFAATQNVQHIILKTCTPRLGYEKNIGMKEHSGTQPKLFETTPIFLPNDNFSWSRRSFIALSSGFSFASKQPPPENWMTPNNRTLAIQKTRLRELVLLQQASLCLAEHCARAPTQICAITGAAGVLLTTLTQGNGANFLCPYTKSAVERMHEISTAALIFRTAEVAAIEDALESQIAALDNVAAVE
jgi:hypothetical protein